MKRREVLWFSVLKEQNIITVILSTHPPKEARKILLEKTNHFKITSLFDEIHATKNYFEAKGEHIINILNKRKIPKKYALMIGDQYLWDYKPAKDIGVDVFLIDSIYRKASPDGKRIKRTIKKLSYILNCLN